MVADDGFSNDTQVLTAPELKAHLASRRSAEAGVESGEKIV